MLFLCHLILILIFPCFLCEPRYFELGTNLRRNSREKYLDLIEFEEQVHLSRKEQGCIREKQGRN